MRKLPKKHLISIKSICIVADFGLALNASHLIVSGSQAGAQQTYPLPFPVLPNMDLAHKHLTIGGGGHASTRGVTRVFAVLIGKVLLGLTSMLFYDDLGKDSKDGDTLRQLSSRSVGLTFKLLVGVWKVFSY